MIQNIAPLRTPLTAALLALTALMATAQEAPTLSAETYGAPSGPAVIQGLGLLLEHVPAEGTAGSLRLFGGVPGQPAALLVGNAPAVAPGPDGTTRLVAGGACVIRGTYDATGAFEVPVADLPRGLVEAGLYAQGVQTGELAWGPIPRQGHALSQGLHLAPASAATSAPFALADLGSRLPEPRRDELDAAFGGGDLTAFLTAALDSDGDEVGLTIDGDLQVTVYPGVSLGGRAGFEALVAREDGAYSVSVERSAALFASVEAGDFAGVEGGRGLAERSVFTFPSAAGAARGLLGLYLAQQLPVGTSLPPLPDRRPLDVAEQAWLQARAQVVTASARVASARAYVARAGNGRRGFAAVAARTAALPVLVAAQTLLRGVRQVEARAFSAVQRARASFESALSGLWMAQRLLFELDGARRYALLHADGGELTFLATGEVELSLVGGVVTLQGTDVGIQAGAERACAVRFHAPDGTGSPVPVEVTLSQMRSAEAWGGVLAGGRAGLERGLVGRLAFEVGSGAAAGMTREVSVEADLWARTELPVHDAAGAAIPGLVRTSGVGRAVAFTLPLEEIVSAAAAMDAQGGALEGLAAAPGDLDLADYRVEGYAARWGLNVAGTGGSIGFEALVTDRGAPLDVDGITAERAQGALTQAAAGWIAPQP